MNYEAGMFACKCNHKKYVVHDIKYVPHFDYSKHFTDGCNTTANNKHIPYESRTSTSRSQPKERAISPRTFMTELNINEGHPK